MIVAKVEYKDNFYNFYSEMPAYIQNGILVLGHNGNSEGSSLFRNSVWYDDKDFEYFCDHRHRGSDMARPHFLYKGKIPYELMRVFSGYGRTVLFTYLKPCGADTYFCKCDDCGKNFIIDYYESNYFKARNLVLPTVRCKSCISKKKKQRK